VLASSLFYLSLFHILFYSFSLFFLRAPGARRAAQGVGSHSILFYLILVCLYIMHQVLVGLSQGFGGLAILFNLI
jgi:hypothetical protein